MVKSSQVALKGVVLLILMVLLWLIYETILEDYLTPSLLRRFLLSYGDFAPGVFLFLLTIRPLFLIPSSLLGLVGGIIFGPVFGAAYMVVGSTMGALLAFALARLFGRGFVVGILEKKIKPLEKVLQSGGWQVILCLRLTPLLSADVVSYGSGLFGVALWPYILGTLVGTIPGAFLFSYLGDSLRTPLSPETLILAAFYLLAFFFLWGYRWLRSRRAEY